MQRRCEVKIRLFPDELLILNKDVERSGLSREAYLRSLIKKRPIKERPSPDLLMTLKQLQLISNNLNQIAVKANAVGFVDAPAYWENVEMLRDVMSSLLEVMYG